MHTTVDGVSTTELHTLKWLKWQIFCHIYFATIKKKKSAPCRDHLQHPCFSQAESLLCRCGIEDEGSFPAKAERRGRSKATDAD